MSSSTLDHARPANPTPEIELDDETTEAIVESLNTLFDPPAARPVRIEDIDEFVNFTIALARQMGVEDEEKVADLVNEASRMYLARAVENQLGSTLRGTFRLGAMMAMPTPSTRGAAFFRRLFRR